LGRFFIYIKIRFNFPNVKSKSCVNFISKTLNDQNFTCSPKM